MCSIFGALGCEVDLVLLERLRKQAGDRGRDGRAN